MKTLKEYMGLDTDWKSLDVVSCQQFISLLESEISVLSITKDIITTLRDKAHTRASIEENNQ